MFVVYLVVVEAALTYPVATARVIRSGVRLGVVRLGVVNLGVVNLGVLGRGVLEAASAWGTMESDAHSRC